MKRLISLFAALLFATAATAAEPQVLVRVLELAAIGPSGDRVPLLADPQGYELPLAAIGRIGERVSGRGLQDGGYHTLTVKLADEYRLQQEDGSVTSRAFDVTPVEMRIRGMLMVRNGEVEPLRMHTPPAYRWRDGHDDGDDD
jgi:hypothetical protein